MGELPFRQGGQHRPGAEQQQPRGLGILLATTVLARYRVLWRACVSSVRFLCTVHSHVGALRAGTDERAMSRVEVKYEDLEMGECIGKGFFGEVRRHVIGLLARQPLLTLVV